MTEREKMIAGLDYRPGDPELAAARARAQGLVRRYNATIVGESDIRAPILAALLGACGPGTAIRAPFHVDYGFNIFIGRDVFLNFGPMFGIPGKQAVTASPPPPRRQIRG
jgi:maltose O-acetyltransferase